MKQKIWVLPVLVLFLECITQSLFASALRYSYGDITVDYEFYTGRKSKVKMAVHEFNLLDSSGELSAGLSNMSSEYAAREGAIADEKEKVRKGESAGGDRIITYNYQTVAAKAGDAKEYGLRLGSQDSIFSTDPLFGNDKKEQYISSAELSMLAAFWGNLLLTNDHVAVRHDVIFGLRFGSFRDIDRRPESGRETTDRKTDSGYFYLPLTYRVGIFAPFGIRAFVEAGGDPITAVRHFASSGDDRIPLDTYFAPAVEKRFFDLLNVGLRIEEYTGSFIAYDKYKIKNPRYKHRMVAAYLSLTEM